MEEAASLRVIWVQEANAEIVAKFRDLSAFNYGAFRARAAKRSKGCIGRRTATSYADTSQSPLPGGEDLTRYKMKSLLVRAMSPFSITDISKALSSSIFSRTIVLPPVLVMEISPILAPPLLPMKLNGWSPSM